MADSLHRRNDILTAGMRARHAPLLQRYGPTLVFIKALGYWLLLTLQLLLIE